MIKRKNNEIATKFKFPAGKYYIGDPCYVLEESIYDKLIENFDFDKSYTIEINGHTMFMHCTSYGDGTYNDGTARSYSVDSGLISIMPVKFISMEKFNETDNVHIVEFEKEFYVSFDDGTFKFGHVEIPTGGDDSQDDEDEDWG